MSSLENIRTGLTIDEIKQPFEDLWSGMGRLGPSATRRDLYFAFCGDRPERLFQRTVGG